MSRPLRLLEPGLLYHVRARSSNRMRLYRDDRDRRHFLAILADVVEAHAVTCHAYCLLHDHYHLVLTTTRPNLPRVIQVLNGRYAQRFNRRHDRVGYVFDGRYRAQILQPDPFLLQACRHVLMNPVRLRLVEAPDEWEWSSYGATCGDVPPPRALDTRALLNGMSPDGYRTAGRRRLRAWLSMPATGEAWSRAPVLGDEAFRRGLRARASPSGRAVPHRERHLDLPLDEVRRGAATRTAREEGLARAARAGVPLVELARCTGMHPSTVSRIVRRVQAREGTGPDRE